MTKIKDIEKHNVQIPRDIWEFIVLYGKEKAVRRVGVPPVGLSWADLLRMYINDHGGNL